MLPAVPKPSAAPVNIRSRASSLALVLLGLQSVLGGVAARAEARDSQRPVILQGYGSDGVDRIVLDLAAQRWIRADSEGRQIGRSHRLIDCSDAGWFCRKGSSRADLAWAIPATCVDAKVGEVWRHAGVDLEVLWRYDPVLPMAGKPGEPPPIAADAQIGIEYLLGSRQRPDVVFRYNQATGVVGAYFRRSRQGPLPYDEARQGRIERTRDSGGPTLYRAVRRPAPFFPVDLARCRVMPTPRQP